MTASIIVPSWNDLPYLKQTIPFMMGAAERHGAAEVLVVDNGSADGTGEYLEHNHPEVRVITVARRTIGAARNFGAQAASGNLLAFVDADCIMDRDHLLAAERVLRQHQVRVTGSRYALPRDPGWIEAVWQQLHVHEQGGPTRLLSAGNFVIEREVFEELGGFDEHLVTGEDAEFCQRLIRRGYTLFSDNSVRVAHLGNPKTLRAFFSREVWYGLGSFGTARWQILDRPILMTLSQLLLTAAAIVMLATAHISFPVVLLLLLTSQLTVPVVTVAYRYISADLHTSVNSATLVPQAIFLYWLYYWARLKALYLIAIRRDKNYTKTTA